MSTRDGTPYFGDPWPSGICNTGRQVPTPEGDPCIHCGEPIEPGDQGTFVHSVTPIEPIVVRETNASSLGVRIRFEPAHRECSLREVLGGIAHVQQMSSCPCRGGDDPDGGYSYRDSARLVWEWYALHGVPE